MQPFSQNAKAAIIKSKEIAGKFNSSVITPTFMLIGLVSLENTFVSGLFGKYGITAEVLLEHISGDSDTKVRPGELEFSSESREVLKSAVLFSRQHGSSAITSEALAWGILDQADRSSISEVYVILFGFLGDYAEAKVTEMKELIEEQASSSGKNAGGSNGSGEGESRSSSENRSESGKRSGSSDEGRRPAKRSKATTTLDKYCRDLTKLASEGKLDPLIGRDNELERVITVLVRRTKCNPVLIGDPGVGKTAIVEGLAQRIVSGEVPEKLKDKRLVSLSIGSLVAGTRYRGDFEDRVNKIIKELSDADANVIVFIDEIHSMVGAGDSDGGGLDAAGLLKPALARGDFQCIGATTVDEYTKYIEKDAALERRFQTIDVKEPSHEDACRILLGLRDRYEKFHDVDISDEAIDEAVRLSVRYIPDRMLPDKAIDVIDEACCRVSLRDSSRPRELNERKEAIREQTRRCQELLKNKDYEAAEELRLKVEHDSVELERMEAEWNERLESGNAGKSRSVVTVGDVAGVVSLMSGVPVEKMSLSEVARLASIEDILHERVVGQDEPIKVVSKAIKRARAGIKDPNRPIGSFLFLGPTGVGKTELARTLAEYLFDDEHAFIRMDMSEYYDGYTVSRLVGPPPGYVGYEEGGELTDAVRRRPYSVVLFDEIEKAHPNVFNILLQIMDEGRLTDSHRHVVDFKNVVVILTSNIGFMAPDPSEGMGIRGIRDDVAPDVKFERMRKKVLDETKQVFKPEFLNRLDASVVFHSLEKEHLTKIADIMVGKVLKELGHADRSFELSDEAKKALVACCRDSQYGARPLRRAIQRMVEDPLADMVIEGKFPSGSKVMIGLDDKGRAALAEIEEAEASGKASKKAPDAEDEYIELSFTVAGEDGSEE